MDWSSYLRELQTIFLDRARATGFRCGRDQYYPWKTVADEKHPVLRSRYLQHCVDCSEFVGIAACAFFLLDDLRDGVDKKNGGAKIGVQYFCRTQESWV
jgi:hypothetical protein